MKSSQREKDLFSRYWLFLSFIDKLAIALLVFAVYTSFTSLCYTCLLHHSYPHPCL